MVWPRPGGSCGWSGMCEAEAVVRGVSVQFPMESGCSRRPRPQPFPNSTNLQKAEINQSLLYRGPIDPANWFGVRKGFPNLGYIQVSERLGGCGAGWPQGPGWAGRTGCNCSFPPSRTTCRSCCCWCSRPWSTGARSTTAASTSWPHCPPRPSAPTAPASSWTRTCSAASSTSSTFSSTNLGWR